MNRMPEKDVDALSALALAHMGDAVYDLLVRRNLCREGRLTAGALHWETVARVSARAQARSAGKLLALLTPEEETVFRRGRNSHSHAAPRGTSETEYHTATALETLFGWLYLRGETERIEELFAHIWAEEE